MIITQSNIKKIITLAKNYGATRLILFGSAIKMSVETHDIDLACDGVQGWKLYEFGAQLESELGALVDIVPLSPPTRFTNYIETKGKVLI